MKDRKFILAILDGWGIGDKSEADAIYNANTPFMDYLTSKYPHSKLLACGENVGLPEGQMGNSEVGHMNIGAGRIVYQDLVRINKAIEDGSFFENKTLLRAFEYAKAENKKVHLIGLVSDGGVHSLDTHLYALCDMAKKIGVEKTYIHALTDGRDTDPYSGKGYIEKTVNRLKNSYGKIATIGGRYYGMDRDKRWERIKTAYDALVKGIGEKARDPVKAVQDSYDKGVTDEFIKPIVLTDEKGEPIATIEDGDVVICFNFRTDRLRELTTVLSQKDFPEYGMKKLDLRYLTMTNYDETFRNVEVVFDKVNIDMTLGEYLSKLGKKQLRIAETEKYAHVTFFFSGGREEKFEGEDRILIHSPKVATYDLKPEMSAPEVTAALLPKIKNREYDFICLNYANGDMVGHTGVYDAIIKAVETVDANLRQVIETAVENDYEALIIADHGNADYAKNPDGSPNTAHSLNPVPCVLVSDRFDKINDGILADVAPTILKVMGLEIPPQMTGKPLV